MHAVTLTLHGENLKPSRQLLHTFLCLLCMPQYYTRRYTVCSCVYLRQADKIKDYLHTYKGQPFMISVSNQSLHAWGMCWELHSLVVQVLELCLKSSWSSSLTSLPFLTSLPHLLPSPPSLPPSPSSLTSLPHLPPSSPSPPSLMQAAVMHRWDKKMQEYPVQQVNERRETLDTSKKNVIDLNSFNDGDVKVNNYTLYSDDPKHWCMIYLCY